MSDVVVIENGGTTIVQVTQSVPTTLEVVENNPVVEVQTVGVQGPPGTPGIATANFIIDGGNTVILTGIKGSLVIPFACTISGWTLMGDAVGSIQLDIWKASYSAYPPSVSNSITATNKPQIVSDIKASSTVLTGWTTSIAANDILVFNVDSASGISRVTLGLNLTRV